MGPIPIFDFAGNYYLKYEYDNMPIQIDFIFPSSSYLFDPFRGDPHTHFQILTVLDWHFGSQVSLRLTDLRGVKPESFKYKIQDADLFLHSVYTLDWHEQKTLVEELRATYPAAKHIAGGPHVLTFTEESKKLFDAIILGDGEESIAEVVNDYIKGELKPVYEQCGKIDINKYPFPKRHFLPKSAVSRSGLISLKNSPGYNELLSTTVIFSRGCTHKCSFCALPNLKKYNPGMRYRTPEHVYEEIEYLKQEFGVQAVSLLDEIGIPPYRKMALPYLDALKKTGIPWKAQCRVDNIDEEIAAKIKDCGCVTLCLGIESPIQECLDLVNKRIDVARSKKTIQILRKFGIETRLYMMIGMPGEPPDIVEKTWQFIEESDPVSVYLSLFTVRPGTDIYDNPDKYGIKNVSSDWTNTMHMFGRYEEEHPKLTFEYKDEILLKSLPVLNVKSLSSEQIVSNYLFLQKKIISADKGPL